MIHVVYTNISRFPSGSYDRLLAKASPARQNRAARYLHPEDALRCLTAGALLTYALGSDVPEPEAAPGEKPRTSSLPDFHFNLSHSGQWVVIAWGDTEVGVDVEQIPRDSSRAALARRYFTEEEQRFVLADSIDMPRRFTEIWTKKESYLKFLSTGLGKNLRSFCVLDPDLAPHFKTQSLEGGYCLSLYSEDDFCSFRMLPPSALL